MNSTEENYRNQVIEYTNKRLKEWYKEAKRSYGITGEGKCYYDTLTESIKIFYQEGLQSNVFSIQYRENESIDYVFQVWSEE